MLCIVLFFLLFFFFFNDPAPTEIYTLSLHDALPISVRCGKAIRRDRNHRVLARKHALQPRPRIDESQPVRTDRKSTRLNSSHTVISYAVFCLKKKKKKKNKQRMIKNTKNDALYVTKR